MDVLFAALAAGWLANTIVYGSIFKGFREEFPKLRMLHCRYCCVFWTSLIMTESMVVCYGLFEFIGYTFAVAMLAEIILRTVFKGELDRELESIKKDLERIKQGIR